MLLNDQSYKVMKWIAQLLLPAIATLYFALSGIWGLPYGEQIIGTITAVDVFLGIILGISSSSYNKGGQDGSILIDSSDPTKDVYRLDLGTNLEILGQKKTVTLSIKPNQDLSGQ